MSTRLPSLRNLDLVWTICLSLAVSLFPGAAIAEKTLLVDLAKLAGFDEKKVRNIGDGTLISELDVKDRSRQASFAGLIKLKSDGSKLVNELLTGELPPSETPEGHFSDPATVADLKTLMFPDDDFEVLSECQLGSCKFKLGEAGIEAVQSFDWNAGDARERFMKIFREAAVQYVDAYRKQGDSALILYSDKPQPFEMAKGVVELVDSMTLVQKHVPSLASYLKTYPQGKPDDLRVDDRMFWSLEHFGYRPTLSVEHVVVGRERDEEGPGAVILVKLIYANHYLAARVQTAGVIDGEAALGVPGTYVLLIDRMLFDDSLGRFKRSLLGGGLKDDVKKRLLQIRAFAGG